MNRLLLLSAMLLLLLTGCGYRFAGQVNNLPDDVRTLYVELFVNRTFEPYLENRLTDQVVEEFARHRTLRTVERKKADASLSGIIKSYVTGPVSYDRDDEITEYRSKLTLLATVRRTDTGKVLWKGALSWTEEYPASDDKIVQEDNEAAAIGVIVDRLAEELHFRVVENF